MIWTWFVMTVLIVGSIAYDSVESPAGSVTNALGGSATYSGLSCQFIQRLHGRANASLVAVVCSGVTSSDPLIPSHTCPELSPLDSA